MLAISTLYSKAAQATIISASTFSEVFRTLPISIPSGDAVVNCDMLEDPSVHMMKAIAVSDANGGIGGASAAVWVEDGWGNEDWLTLPSGAKQVDVALSNSWNFSTGTIDYKLLLTYCISATLYLEIYSINNVQFPVSHPLTPFNISNSPSYSSNTISTSCNGYPHIDMWAQNQAQIFGVASMQKFAVVWSESSNYTLRGYIASVPSPVSSPFTILGGTGYTGCMTPDVSCLTDISFMPWVEYMEVSYGYVAPGKPRAHEWRMLEYDVSVGIVTTGYPITLPTANTHGGHVYMPRIESANFYPGDWANVVKWQTVADVEDASGSSAGPYEVWGYNNLNATTGGYSISASQFTVSGGDISMAACVAAGLEISNTSAVAGIGNHQYTVGFWNSNGQHLYARDIASATAVWPAVYTAGALISPTDWYEVNSSSAPMGFTTQIAKNFAMSHCTNSGKDLLTAWYDGADMVYKYSQPDVMAFRGAVPKDLTLTEPAVTKALHLPGAAGNTRYGIFGAAGNTLLKGTIGSTVNSIDVASLPAGTYKMKVWQPGAAIQDLQFTKL